jgi:hypothetical protein
MRAAMIATIVLAFVVVTSAIDPAIAIADNASRIAELGSKLQSSSSTTERISAVTALARLGDRRAWKPLVNALKDPSPVVRALAANALGKIGHKGALPALGEASTDSDAGVRKQADAAMVTIRKTNNMATNTRVDPHASKAGFGTSPREVTARPDLYVVVKTVSDDAPGRHDKKARKQHAEFLKNTMAIQFKATATVTNVAADAERYGLDLRNLDVSVTKLEHRTIGNMVEVEAQLRLAISDGGGRMLSFLSGGAMVQVPKRTFDNRYLPQLRTEAIDNAIRGMFDKLLAHLRRGAGS